MSGHGIAAGASGFHPDDASSTLAARSNKPKLKIEYGKALSDRSDHFLEDVIRFRYYEGDTKTPMLFENLKSGLEWIRVRPDKETRVKHLQEFIDKSPGGDFTLVMHWPS